MPVNMAPEDFDPQELHEDDYRSLKAIRDIIDNLRMENQTLRNDNENLKVEKTQLQDKISHLAGENEGLKTKLRDHHSQIEFNGDIRGDLTTIKGGLKEVQQKIDRILNGEKRLKDEDQEVKPGTIKFCR